jgi:hypothetical protein
MMSKFIMKYLNSCLVVKVRLYSHEVETAQVFRAEFEVKVGTCLAPSFPL